MTSDLREKELAGGEAELPTQYAWELDCSQLSIKGWPEGQAECEARVSRSYRESLSRSIGEPLASAPLYSYQTGTRVDPHSVYCVMWSPDMAGVRVATVADLQLSNGSWKLSTLAVGMATTKRDLEAKCPAPLSSSAAMATVWATIIGITILKQVNETPPPLNETPPFPTR